MRRITREEPCSARVRRVMPIISEAGAVITAPGVYTLDRDLVFSGKTGSAITIAADNVVIDLNGHTITGSRAADSFASAISAADRSGITVRNGSIEGFFYGVRLDDSSTGTVRYGNHLVSNLDVSDCTFRGITVQGVGNVVRDCVVSDIQGTTNYDNAFACGIETLGPRAQLLNNLVTDVYARDMGEALGISVSNNGVGTVVAGNTIRNTTFDEFRSFGIWVGGGSNVTSYGNSVTNYTYGQGWSSVNTGVFYNNTSVNCVVWFHNGNPTGIIDRGGNTVIGTSAPDNFVGSDVANYFQGRGGDDQLYGMGGADRLSGGAGADLLDGGSGYDQVRYDDAAYGSFIVSLENPAMNTGAAFGDTLVSIECLVLSRGNDMAFGDAANNTIEGMAGHDSLFGRDGADGLYGGDGHDHLYGGNGGDLHDGGAGFDYVRFDEAAYGSFVISLLTPSLNTGPAAGDRYLRVEGVIASSGDDVVYGDNAANWLYGREGNDTLYGYAGKDHLIGEAGADRFMFDTRPTAANVDTIEDFVSGQDSIGLARFFFGGADDGAGGIRFVAGAGAKAATAAATVLYDTGTHLLAYDANGKATGGIVPIAYVDVVAASDLFFI
jgi:Ca2+-binding RTX toxin-like protein